jgi:hypothetical protein
LHVDALTNLIDPAYRPLRSYSDLLRAGIPHKGGLAMLATAERLERPVPAIAALA